MTVKLCVYHMRGTFICKKYPLMVRNEAIFIQLFRGRLSEKNVHATIPKGNMGYDQFTVPDTIAFEPTFVTFL